MECKGLEGLQRQNSSILCIQKESTIIEYNWLLIRSEEATSYPELTKDIIPITTVMTHLWQEFTACYSVATCSPQTFSVPKIL